MPSFDGKGPQGKGPMTGRGLGHCVLRESKEKPGRFEGWVGISGVPVGDMNREREEQEKEVIHMPLGDGTGPVGTGPMTGRAAGFCAGCPVPCTRNPGVLAVRQAAPYGAPVYRAGAGYVAPRTGWFGRLIRGGLGLGRGLGRGRGRAWRGRWGGFGYWY